MPGPGLSPFEFAAFDLAFLSKWVISSGAQCLSFRLWKDERYLACARLAADNVASRGLLKKGFGICHGISGSGLSLLCMHRADPSSGKGYAETAARMALFSCLEGDVKDALLRQPDRPQSLMEGTAAWAVS